jgi:CRP/FNR family transcriptional regulator, cyclic AMP receptor protein
MVCKSGRGAVREILGQADFFGEQSISGQAAYLSPAVALVPTTIIAIKRDTMLRLVREQKSVSTQFLNYVLARNTEFNKTERLHFQFEREGLARMLLLASHQGSKSDPSILEAIRQNNLAEMVGTTRQRVNFFMNEFRRLGFIQYHGGVKIHSSLRKILEEDGRPAQRPTSFSLISSKTCAVIHLQLRVRLGRRLISRFDFSARRRRVPRDRRQRAPLQFRRASGASGARSERPRPAESREWAGDS